MANRDFRGNNFMLKEKLLPISIFTLAFAIIIGAFIISRSIGVNKELVVNDMGNYLNSYNQEYLKDNLDLSEAAEYLNISEHQLLELTTLYDPGMPYVKIDGIYIFNRNAINNWLETARVEIN